VLFALAELLVLLWRRVQLDSISIRTHIKLLLINHSSSYHDSLSSFSVIYLFSALRASAIAYSLRVSVCLYVTLENRELCQKC